MKNIHLVVKLVLIASMLIAPGGFVQAKQTSLRLLIDEALKNSPRVQATYNEWKAAEYRIRQASSLPDPTARYTYFGQNIETRVGPQEAKYGASQKFPFPGKLSLKGKATRKKADILKEKYEASKRQLIKDVKFAYYDIFWLDRAIQIVEEEKLIVENLENVARRKYESAITSQQDVIKANVEISKLLDKLYSFKQQRNGLAAKMNSLLDRPAGSKFDKVLNIDSAEFNHTIEELHSIAKETKQELIAANLNIERAKYEKSLAMMDYLPDFTVGVDYIEVGSGKTAHLSDGEDAWVGMVSVNVPIWFDKLGAQVNEKKASLEASKKRFEDVENTIASEVVDLHFKINTYRDIVRLYKTALIPQTEQAFDAARIAYETGKVDFLSWLDSERILLQTRLAYYKSIVDYEKAIAYLERVVGRDL